MGNKTKKPKVFKDAVVLFMQWPLRACLNFPKTAAMAKSTPTSLSLPTGNLRSEGPREREGRVRLGAPRG